ncbi:DUF6122 family protein [Psychroserpens damuponensis]|uniref:DUF6122 family protein n=1 Tax=Psychroserpens damuponensis TaxID=943936 RepID=UPI00058E89EC|nr:DUF6122 family protein [Psychroserpens damuponensis]
MLQPIVHYGIHFIVPIVVALIFFRENWKVASLIMLAAILIDLDHLLANPIFDPTRCSINYHPLHSYYAIGVYMVLTLIKKTRVIGLGLLIHMVADWVDCLLM